MTKYYDHWKGVWPYQHVTKEQIIDEYNLIGKVIKDLNRILIEKDCRLKPAQHHIPGYRIHAWVDGFLIKYLSEKYGIKNRFYEQVHLDFKIPVTRETLGEKVIFEYIVGDVRHLSKQKRIVIQFDVKVSSNGSLLVETTKGKPLTIIGPNPEIFLPDEYKNVHSNQQVIVPSLEIISSG